MFFVLETFLTLEGAQAVIWEGGTGPKPISGRVDRASATETVDSDLIPGRVKPKTIKIGIHSFTA